MSSVDSPTCPSLTLTSAGMSALRGCLAAINPIAEVKEHPLLLLPESTMQLDELLNSF